MSAAEDGGDNVVPISGREKKEKKTHTPVKLLTWGRQPRKCVANIIKVLNGADECAGMLVHDTFRDAPIVLRDPPTMPRSKPAARESAEWAEDDSTRFAEWLVNMHELDVSSRMVEEAVVVVSKQRVKHPVKDWLEGLVWDGEKRLTTLFSKYFNAEDDTYTRGVAVCWMVSAVARVFSPGCQADYLIVLEGDEGTGKTTGLKALVGAEWFSDTALDIDNKDGVQCLRGKWVHSFDELRGLKGKSASKVKNFLSRAADNIRPSFGRRNRDYPRQNVFCATTNDEEYLQGDKNRRFWPIACGDAPVDVAGLGRDREQLWAEAVALYKAGQKWHPDAELLVLCRDEQESRSSAHPWTGTVSKYANAWAKHVLPKHPEKGLSAAMVLAECLGKEASRMGFGDEQVIAGILRGMGWFRLRKRIGSGAREYQWFPPLPPLT